MPFLDSDVTTLIDGAGCVREVFLSCAKGKASSEIQAFLAFLKSSDGAKAIKANGAIARRQVYDPR